MTGDEQRPARTARTTGDDRSGFDRFVEAAYTQVSQAPFFFVCAGLILAWLVSAPLWVDLK
ncbi:MAG: low affinity iron permease family protein, partial [Solirubrobacteraceae bacterium]